MKVYICIYIYMYIKINRENLAVCRVFPSNNVISRKKIFIFRMWQINTLIWIAWWADTLERKRQFQIPNIRYSDVIMSAIVSQITGVSMVCSTVSSGADQRKHQTSASLVFVRRIERWPVNFPYKETVIRKKFIFDDVIFPMWKTHQCPMLPIHLLPRVQKTYSCAR